MCICTRALLPPSLLFLLFSLLSELMRRVRRYALPRVYIQSTLSNVISPYTEEPRDFEGSNVFASGRLRIILAHPVLSCSCCCWEWRPEARPCSAAGDYSASDGTRNAWRMLDGGPWEWDPSRPPAAAPSSPGRRHGSRGSRRSWAAFRIGTWSYRAICRKVPSICETRHVGQMILSGNIKV